MAQIDIKNCNVYIRDGYAGAANVSAIKVNLMAGYAVGTTTMVVDGATGAVVTGDYFTVGGRATRYLITGHSETLGATTSITFTPGLVTAALDDDDIDIAPKQLTIRIGEGNASWTEKRPITYVKDRGLLDTVREGDQEPVEVKLDATWVFLKADTGDPPTIEDALKKRGEASGWLTTSDDPCEPYSVDIVIEYTPPCSTEKLEIYTIQDFRYEEIGHDLKAGTLSLTGKCNVVEVTTTRVDP